MAFEGTLQDFTVNMHGPELEHTCIEVQQGDTASRRVRIHLKDFGGADFKIPYGATAVFCINKSDGHKVYDACEIEDESTVIVTLSNQAIACAGRQKAQVYITKDGWDIKTQVFTVNVPRAIYTDDAIKSSDEFGILSELIAEYEAIVDSAGQSAVSAADSAAASEAARQAADQLKQDTETMKTSVEQTVTNFGPVVNKAIESVNAAGTDQIASVQAEGAKQEAIVKEAAAGFATLKEDHMSWSQWFDLHRTGWHGGVTFPRFSVSQSPLGTKTGDNADMVVQTSTNTKKGRNDFADSPVTDLMFNGIEVNGYIDEDGEPHITAVKGSPEFSRDGINGDVYMAFLTPFYKRVYNDEVDGWDFADHQVDDLKPWDGAVRPDGTYRSYYFVAKYPGVKNDDGIVASISGRAPIRSVSHNSQITMFAAKGTQYCGFTSTDVAWAQWMNDMKFANRNSQATMTGATEYYLQYPATVIEDNVMRIIISKSNASNLLVGSFVSIGYGTVSSGSVNIDRSAQNIHKYADDVKILKIEDYDDGNSAVYVDAPAPFSTANVQLNDTLSSPVYILTMHWRSGSCDEVLGSDGSPSDPLNWKEPFVLSGVEFGHGGYTVISDVILNGVYDADTDTYSQTPYVVNDNRKISSAITADYTELGYSLPDTQNNWKYISEAGYDAQYPWVELPPTVAASSTTGFCDGLHAGIRSSGLREWLWFGRLGHGSPAGLRYVNAYSSLSATWWGALLRLSSLRRGAAA